MRLKKITVSYSNQTSRSIFLHVVLKNTKAPAQKVVEGLRHLAATADLSDKLKKGQKALA